MRSHAALQTVLLPRGIQLTPSRNGNLDDGPVLQWLHGRVAQALQHLGAQQPGLQGELQAFLQAQPEQLRNALQGVFA